MEPLTFLVLHYCQWLLPRSVCVYSVKIAVCHCDTAHGDMMLMTLLLKWTAWLKLAPDPKRSELSQHKDTLSVEQLALNSAAARVPLISQQDPVCVHSSS